MPLIIDDANTFDIVIVHNGNMDNFYIYDLPAPEGTATETDSFTFRRPNWVDIRNMNSASVLVDAVSGKAIIDPYRYMDLKVKTLLKDWTVKLGQEKLPLSPDNVNRLHPNLISYLFQKVEEKLATSELKPAEQQPSEG